MQLRLELRPVSVLATEDPLFEQAFFYRIFKIFSDRLEMLASFVGDAAFGVACVVAHESVAASAANKRMKEVHALVEFAAAQLEETRAMTIDQHDAEAGKRSQQLSQRLQVEMAIDGKFGAAELGGQIVLAPEALRRAGEDGFGVRAVAAEFLREAHDAVEIGAGRFVLALAAIAFVFPLAQRSAHQVGGEDGVWLVGLVARGWGLKLVSQSVGFRIFNLG